MFRCQAAVLFNSPEDNLGICYQCRYTFCRRCREIYHFQAMCPKDYVIEQLRLRQERERQRLEKEREELLARMTKNSEEKKATEERRLIKERYRHLVIKLSEQNALIEELVNAERIDLLNTQRCPNCHVRIEKNGGCSHMHCSRCNHHFTWASIVKPTDTNTVKFLNSDSDLDAAKEQFYEGARTGRVQNNVTTKDKYSFFFYQ